MTARIGDHVLAACLLVTLAIALVPPVAANPGVTFSFDGTDYFHRWSRDGQNEFTPRGEEDLSAWTSMVTIVVHDWARNGDQLAELANRVLGNYQDHGKILRTDSRPRTKTGRPNTSWPPCSGPRSTWRPPSRGCCWPRAGGS